MPTSEVNASATVATTSSATVQLYYYNAGVRTTDAGQAAGVVVDAVLGYKNIQNALGTSIATKNDTSLAYTCDALTTELDWYAYPDIVAVMEGTDNLTPAKKSAAVGALLTNGQFIIDYRSGLLIGKKATTTATMTSVTMKTSVTMSSDIEIGAVEIKDGSTDARALVSPANTARSATDNVLLVQTVDATGTIGGGGGSSASVGGGASTYSNIQGDFTATANTGAKTITLSAYANAVWSAALTAKNFAAASIKRISSTGAVDALPVTNVTFAANVLTLSNMSANFNAGDTVTVVVPGIDKGFIAATNINQNAITDGTNQVAIETAGADGVSNTANALVTKSRLKAFNGTTWDRVRCGITACTATLTGWLNMLPWAVYNATPTTRTEGQGGPLQADALGNMKGVEQYAPGYEDNVANVAKVENRYSYNYITTATTTVIKSGAGFLHGITIGKHIAANAISVFDNTAGSGTTMIIITPGASLLGDPPYNAIIDVAFSTGLTVVTAGASFVNVSYR